jgi:gamma-glutamyltranspeptidase/glutathione hydrolase
MAVLRKSPRIQKKAGKFRQVLKIIGFSLLGLIVVLTAVYLLLPKGPRDLIPYQDRAGTSKKMVVAENYAVVTGTPWATEAAISMLEKGGNAYDAAVAALLVLNVTNGVHASFPSVAPVMIYDASSSQVRSYIGAGTAPAAASLESFQKRGWETVPSINIWSQLVPASPDVMIALLQDYGTLSFTEVSAPAIQIARDGFPATLPLLMDMGEFGIFARLAYCAMFPYNGQVWFQGECWRPLLAHDRMRFPDLANTFQAMADSEQAALRAGGSRRDGLQAVRDLFYRGALADKIVAFQEQNGGLISQEDLAGYSGAWEQPVTGSYGEYTFYTNSGWTQGMVGPLALQILDGIDLKSMGHNSAEYIHTVTQAIELAMADREAYVGDPAFVKVPWDVLMSKAYAAQRRLKMTDGAFGPLPAPGEIPGYSSGSIPVSPSPYLESGFAGDLRIGQDTTQLVVVDSMGNAVVMTPSDFPWTRMVPGTGMNLGNRMNQFRMDPENVDVIAPGKRPRITPHAVIVFKNGEFYMAYSTPGGDMQAQALVQVFFNIAVFGMDAQEAVSMPRFYSISAPSSFAPHEASPGTLRLEADLYDQVATDLQARGYTLVRDTVWNFDFGGVGAILHGADGKLYAAADPRWETWALGK